MTGFMARGDAGGADEGEYAENPSAQGERRFGSFPGGTRHEGSLGRHAQRRKGGSRVVEKICEAMVGRGLAGPE